MLGLPKGIRNILAGNIADILNMCSENIVVIAGAPVEVELLVLVDKSLSDSVAKGYMHQEARHRLF